MAVIWIELQQYVVQRWKDKELAVLSNWDLIRLNPQYK